MSRKPLPASTSPLTLADLRDRVLPLRRRQDVASALRSLEKALGRRLEELPAHPAIIRQRLKEFAPAMHGISPRRWRNVLSLTRFALKHAGLTQMPGRHREPLASEWAGLFNHLPDAHARYGLTRLARYCSIRRVTPQQVDDETARAFLADMESAGLVNKPRQVHRTACVLWNRAADTILEWPKQRLVVPNYRNRYVLPWTTWPASLKADFEAYLERLASKDILDESDFPQLKSSSLKTRKIQLLGYMSALVHRGRDPSSMRTLADVVSVDAVKDGLRFFLERAAGKRKSHIHYIACAITAVARHWVGVDQAQIRKLSDICGSVNPGQQGMTEKNRSRLRQLDDPANVHALLALPKRIQERIPRAGTPTYSQALQAQTALAIELLLMVPLRIGNLSRIDIERHLVRTSGSDVMHLAIPADEVKNGTDIDAVLPAELAKLLGLYLDRYRPILASESSNWLFPGRDKKSKNSQGLGEQIVSCVKRHCGLKINPHLFRHIAAKLYLDANPGAYGVIRLIHGHKSVETTTQYYCGAEGPAAMRHYDQQILKLRNQPLAASRKPRRGSVQ